MHDGDVNVVADIVVAVVAGLLVVVEMAELILI